MRVYLICIIIHLFILCFFSILFSYEKCYFPRLFLPLFVPCVLHQLCHLVFRINNCVGEENHFAFMLLLLYAMLLSTYALILTFFHFWIWPKCSSCDKVS